jgi:hypothetical protein
MSKTHRPSATGNSAQRAAIVSCWMCGVRLHATQMVPDGGSACDDIRWYCKDARACTERWTTSRHTLAQANASDKDGKSDTTTSEASPADHVEAVTWDASSRRSVITGT